MPGLYQKEMGHVRHTFQRSNSNSICGHKQPQMQFFLECITLFHSACSFVIITFQSILSCTIQEWVPGQEDALHHREVLHEDISVRFGAEVSHSITDAQLDGSFQCGCCGLPSKYISKKKTISSSMALFITFSLFVN